MSFIARESVHKVSTKSSPATASPRFTATQIAGLKPTGRSRDFSDPLVRGLVLRLGPTGTKRWLFRFKWNRKPSRIGLGSFPTITLAAARDSAIANGVLLKRGIDPRQAARPERRSPRHGIAGQSVSAARERATPDVDTLLTRRLINDKHVISIPAPGDKTSVQFLAYEYVEHFVNRSHEQPTEVIRILNKDVLRYWGHRDARTICAREVIERLDAIVARGAPVMANRTADILGQMFKYGIHRTIVSNSPVQLLFKPGGKEKTGKRVFSDKEIIAFLHGLPAVCTAPQKVHIIRLLLLTLQRRSALGLAEWNEVDFEECVWRIPAEHDKERRAHILPLTDWAVSEFKALKTLSKDSRFVVPNKKGDKAANPQLITRSVTRLQERFQAIGIEPFKTHDLRRTGRTHMSKLGVQKHISERVLNHSMGEIEATNDLYEYTKEKRDALKRWEKQLRKLQATPRGEPSAEVVMKKLFKEKLKRRTPVEQRKKSRDEPVLRLGH
jgi:integrase